MGGRGGLEEERSRLRARSDRHDRCSPLARVKAKEPRRVVSSLVALLALLAAAATGAAAPSDLRRTPASGSATATVLVYHRFGPVVADGMTVRTEDLARQLEYLHDNGYTVVPLRDVVNFVTKGAQLPARPVAITVDDGHRSVFSEMLPLVRRYRIPVTLFIYPSAISNASYAMTWDQLRELKQTGLFDIQSHTYWHPNFKRERRRLSPDEFAALVHMQLTKPLRVLKARLDVDADLLAWPFGIYDDDLIRAARDAGYVAGFTLDRRPVVSTANPMAIPRFLMTDATKGKIFERTLPTGYTTTTHP
jgi:peptidoglycan/xylan/chitin deacetylase (PgdA/CDA1 family)